ncbi:phage tail-collar fiber domain-containing protein [Stutzerimonas stutzeri]
MGATITIAGEDLIAQKQAAQQPLNITRFIFAQVAGQNPSTPIDRAAEMPIYANIVHEYTIPTENRGYVNPSQVVYSAQIGSDVGDWNYNWIGLVTAEGVLFAVATVPLQQKRRNIPPHQVGNNITRNFLVAFDGAQALTGITIDASTWQHDFTVRLAGIDERERLSNRDIYGRACFFGNSLQLEKVGSGYQLKPGTAYVEGMRLQLDAAHPVMQPPFPCRAMLDVALKRELNDVVASWRLAYVDEHAGNQDYTDSAGFRHHYIAIADLPNSSTITDRRTVEPVSSPLVGMIAFRNGDYMGLRARATTKADVGLGNLPNAKSDDPASNSSDILATTAALNFAMGQSVRSLEGMVATFARNTPPPGWLKANGAAVSRTTYAALFAAIGTTFGNGDGSTTFTLPDLRGEFVRGWDDVRGIDAGRAFGTIQEGQNASHSHTGRAGSGGSHSHSYTDYRTAPSTSGAGAGTGSGFTTQALASTTQSAGSHSHSVTIDESGGTEARPRNIALLACIKF